MDSPDLFINILNSNASIQYDNDCTKKYPINSTFTKLKVLPAMVPNNIEVRKTKKVDNKEIIDTSIIFT